jgi:hypothetical protein
MNIATLFNRRRYSFGRVFWVTLAIYLFFMVVGLVAMYVSPAMNNAPNWEKIFSWQNVVNQVVSVLFFVLFYFVTLNMFHRLIIGKHKPVNFVQPVVLSFLMIGAYYTVSFLCFTNTKFELSVN